MPALTRQKSTFAEMRASGVRGLIVYCTDCRCSHSVAISGDPWEDDVRLSDIEPRFTCRACGQKGADVRPNFDWEPEARASRQRALALKLGRNAWNLFRAGRLVLTRAGLLQCLGRPNMGPPPVTVNQRYDAIQSLFRQPQRKPY
jgi:hypothetical protein